MLSDRLRLAMQQANMSQAELARACGVRPPSVSGWLSDKSKYLRGENLLRAAKALGVSDIWLATGVGYMQRGSAAPDNGMNAGDSNDVGISTDFSASQASSPVQLIRAAAAVSNTQGIFSAPDQEANAEDSKDASLSFHFSPFKGSVPARSLQKARRENLKVWLDENPVPKAEKSYFSQLIAGTAPFGEKAARRIEQDYGIPRGFLDFDSVVRPALPASDPRLKLIMGELAKLDERHRVAALKMLRIFVDALKG